MKLPRFVASGGVRETGLIRAQDIGALTNVGDAEFRAIQQAGAAIGNVADLGFRAFMSRQTLDDKQKIGELNRKAQEAERLEVSAIGSRNLIGEQSLPDDKAYWDGTKGLNSVWKTNEIKTAQENAFSKIKTLSVGIKNPNTRKEWENDQVLNSDLAITKAWNAKYNDYQTTTFLSNARIAAINGDFEIANKWIDDAITGGLITFERGAKEKTNFMKEFFQNSAVRNAEETIDALNEELTARKKGKGIIPEEIMTDADLNDSLKSVRIIQKENIVAFENDLNAKLVNMDNASDLSQIDFDSQSEALKTSILLANIPGTQKRKMLTDLERWRRGTNEIDYARILALNQEMDAAQRSGIVDPTIGDRITNTNLEGAFGGRNKGGQKNYGILIRRFEKLKFDERVQATVSIVHNFERENADDPRLIFLFHQAKNKVITESPDASTRELFISISALAEAYSVLPEATIIQEMTSEGITAPKQKPIIKTEQGVGPGTIPSTKQLERDLKAVQMQGPTGIPIRASLATIGSRLDRGDVFPPGSNVKVKKNPSDKDVIFEGITIEPGRRVISFDGGKTWQLLP